MSLTNIPFSTITYLTLLVAYTLALLVPSTLEFRASLGHVDQNKNLTKIELLRLALSPRGRRRLEWLQSAASKDPVIVSTVTTSTDYLYSDYSVTLSIGNPPQTLSFSIATSTDLTWTQCTRSKNGPTNLFNPKKSSSYKQLKCSTEARTNDTCTYDLTYADDSWSQGELATEAFHFEGTTSPFRNVSFGCGFNNSKGLAGVLGLAPTGRSLVAQLGVDIFSTCLPPAGSSKKGVLMMGSGARGPSRAPTTQLLINESLGPYYRLSLQGIVVGRVPLQVNMSSFTVNPNGTGGMIINSGTTITLLERGVFEVLKQEFASQIKLPPANGSEIDPGLELCFRSCAVSTKHHRKTKIPKLVFKFDRAKLSFPKENYYVEDNGTGCLAMGAARPGEPSVLGNFQQQNMLVVYDIGMKKISFQTNIDCENM